MGNQPGSFQPRGEDWMVRELQTLRRELNELRAANVFGRTGIMPRDGGTDFEGYVNINGEGVVNGPLEVNGDSEFNGSLSINGPLFLQPGSIENDALTNPVRFDAGVADNEDLTITLVDTTICTYSFTIPAGFTQAFVIGYGSIGVTNPTASNSSIAGRVYIDRPVGGSTWGPRRYQQALANSDSAVYPFKQTIINGLAGGETVTVRMTAINTGSTDWGATPGGGSLNVSVYFTR
jgi:hypothetical protein